MICAECGETTTVEESCERCGEPPLLDGRYRLEKVIGHGGNGITYSARRLTDDLRVCVKELAFHRLASLEAEKLFRREAAVLRRLDHPQIPAYIEDLVSGSGRSLGLYMVQTFVDGHDLQHELSERIYSQPEVLAIADELLGIVDYLHTRTPPVVHRDIKPSNVMRRAADNSLVLVDFGSVRRLNPTDAKGRATNTIAGTYGYMAPEQFRGHADPRSDVYSVGALALALATQSDPADLTGSGMERHELDWKRVIAADSQLGRFLSATLAVDPDARPANAGQARALIDSIRRTPAPAPQHTPAPRAAPPRRSAPPSPLRPPNGRPAIIRQLAVAQSRQIRSERSGAKPVLFVALGLALIALVSGAIAFQTAKPEAEVVADQISLVPVEAAANSQAQAVCPTGQCAAFDTPFVGKLNFGMSTAAAIEAVPALATPIPIGEPRANGARGASGPERVDANLLIADTPAACSFYFPKKLGLAEVTCSLLLADNYTEAMSNVESMLRSRYGAPTKEDTSLRVYRTTSWRDDRALLEVRGTNYASIDASINMPATITVLQRWQRLVDADAAREAKEAAAAREKTQAQRRAAAERARAAAERATEAAKKAAAPK